MTLVLDWVTIDAENLALIADFWSAALDYDIAEATDEEILLVPRDGSRRRLLVGRGADPKMGKNRLHLDLRPDDQDREVARLEAIGARRVDIGQGEVTWIVMADPEGNEFCVLRALRADEGHVPYGD